MNKSEVVRPPEQGAYAAPDFVQREMVMRNWGSLEQMECWTKRRRISGRVRYGHTAQDDCKGKERARQAMALRAD